MKDFRLPLFIFMIFIAMSVSNASYVYQESGENYTCTGTMSNPLNFNDTNWTTSASSSSAFASDYCYVNYTKPLGAVNTSLWYISDGTAPQQFSNLTFTSGCWSQDPLQLRGRSTGNVNPVSWSLGWECYDGAGWNSLRSRSNVNKALYEEAMWWDIKTPIDTCNYTINASGEYNLTADLNVSANQTSGNECIKIEANDVILNCDGYKIFSDDKSANLNGVVARYVSGITLKNCKFENIKQAIQFDDVNSSFVYNNSVINSSYSQFYSKNDLLIENNSFDYIGSVYIHGVGDIPTINFIRNNISNYDSFALSVNGNKLLIDRNRITNSNYSHTRALQMSATNNTIISNNYIANNSYCVGLCSVGLVVEHSNQNITIIGNELFNLTNSAIFIGADGSSWESKNITVRDNYIHDCNSEGITLDGYGGGHDLYAINNTINNTSTGIHVKNNKINLEIRDNTITNVGGSSGILFDSNVSNTLVENNTIDNAGFGIYLAQSNNITTRFNRITNIVNHGIRLDSGQINSLIDQNNVSFVGYGIITQQFNNNYNNITNNIVHDTTNEGIFLAIGDEYNRVEHNIVYNSLNGGIQSNGADNNYIGFNDVSNVTYSMITVWNSSNITIESNYLHDTLNGGIWLNTVASNNNNNITIFNNTLLNLNNYGIASHYTDNSFVINNHVSNYKNLGILWDLEGDNNFIAHNLVEKGIGSGIQIYNIGYATAYNNVIFNNTIRDLSNVAGYWGITIRNVNNVNVSSNVISNSTGNGGVGIIGNDIYNSNIVSNTISMINAHGILIDQTSNNLNISYNDISDIKTASGGNIFINSGSNTNINIDNNYIHDSNITVNSNTLRGINIAEGTSNINIYSNNFQRLYNYGMNSNTYAVLLSSYTNPIDNITIHDNIFNSIRAPVSESNYVGFGEAIWMLNDANDVKVYDNVVGDTAVTINTINTGGVKLLDRVEIYNNDLCGFMVPMVIDGWGYNNSIHHNYIHCGWDGLFGAGIGIVDTYTSNPIYNNYIYDNIRGFRIGYTALGFSPTVNTTAYNNTIWNNGEGIFVNSGSYNNTFSQNRLYNNVNSEITILSGANNTFDREVLGTGTITTIDSVTGNNFTVKAVQVADRPDLPPAQPSKRYVALGDYINISKTNSIAVVSLRTYYDLGTTGIDEGSVVMWKYNNGTWTNLNGNLDMTNNYIEVTNITDFSIFVTAGQQPMTEIIKESGVNALTEMLSWLPIILPILILSFIIGAFVFGRFDVDTLVTGIFILIVVVLALVLGALILTKMGIGG